MLLEDGYSALKAGSYDGARQLYREAVALAPESKEARTGLEKAFEPLPRKYSLHAKYYLGREVFAARALSARGEVF